MTEQYHISSLLITAKPELAPRVVKQIEAMSTAEVAHSDDVGKIIVALETTDESSIVDALSSIQLFDGVVSAALVYHHAEDVATALSPLLPAAPNSPPPLRPRKREAHVRYFPTRCH